MATIQLNDDNVGASIRWMKWVENDEIIGQILRGGVGRYRIVPLGPHWSPMKSFAGFSFESEQQALVEVQLYFRGR
jgi:hypothetical protein